MKQSKFILTFLMLLVLQLILTKFCQIGAFVYVSLLPAMILCYPTSRPLPVAMLVAFASGLLVDALADGVPGLNASAAVAVAATRNLLIEIFLDSDIVERHYTLSFKKNGFMKITTATAAGLLLFLIIYVILDCAGTRSFGFITGKIILSFIIGMILNLCTVKILTEEKI